MTDILLFDNKTLYEQYVQTINNFTSLRQYNYVSNGYGPITLLEGERVTKEMLMNNTILFNFTVVDQDRFLKTNKYGYFEMKINNSVINLKGSP